MNIAFKNDDLFRSFCTIPRHPILIEVMLWMNYLKIGRQRLELIVTSDHREKLIHDKDPGIHNTDPQRAIDFRSWTMRNPEIIKEKINKAWIYDPNRPKFKVCVYHNIGQGHHFHIQVCKNTKLHPDKSNKQLKGG